MACLARAGLVTVLDLFGHARAEGPDHPARYSVELRPLQRSWMAGLSLILDPMAGVGTLGLPGLIHGELEMPWALQCPSPAYQGDACHLPFPDCTFAGVVVSCAYGNRMADRYAGDPRGSRRHTYRISLGHPLRPESGASAQWGPRYQEVHQKAWGEVWRVLRPGGVFVLNCKDHYRKDTLIEVCAWHVSTCMALGFLPPAVKAVRCPGNRDGANGSKRVDHEMVYRMVKP
jgi:SAM-dependent methyltransferase